MESSSLSPAWFIAIELKKRCVCFNTLFTLTLCSFWAELVSAGRASLCSWWQTPQRVRDAQHAWSSCPPICGSACSHRQGTWLAQSQCCVGTKLHWPDLASRVHRICPVEPPTSCVPSEGCGGDRLSPHRPSAMPFGVYSNNPGHPAFNFSESLKYLHSSCLTKTLSP